MDIAALSMIMSQSSVSSQIGIALTKMSMESAEQMSQAMTDMAKTMELSVNPHIGSIIDLKA